MDICINMCDSLSYYSPEDSSITLGYEFKEAIEILNESEFNEFISDTITHEFIHKILNEQFNWVTSQLYDTIEHYISNMDIKRRVFKVIQKIKNDIYPMTWNDSIKLEGFMSFLLQYNICRNDIEKALTICNCREA